MEDMSPQCRRLKKMGNIPVDLQIFFSCAPTDAAAGAVWSNTPTTGSYIKNGDGCDGCGTNGPPRFLSLPAKII